MSTSKRGIRQRAWRMVERGARTLMAGVVSRIRERVERRRHRAPKGRDRGAQGAAPVEHADERTIRRIAEAQAGGVSSEESDSRFARGENPGGLHHKMAHHEGPEHQRPELDEPQEREERRPRHERHLRALRRGSA